MKKLIPYAVLFIIGAGITIASCFFRPLECVFASVGMAVGSGMLTSSLVGFFIEKSNIKRDSSRLQGQKQYLLSDFKNSLNNAEEVFNEYLKKFEYNGETGRVVVNKINNKRYSIYIGQPSKISWAKSATERLNADFKFNVQIYDAAHHVCHHSNDLLKIKSFLLVNGILNSKELLKIEKIHANFSCLEKDNESRQNQLLTTHLESFLEDIQSLKLEDSFKS